MRALLRTASRWLWAALAEDEDRLRRFLFAFFGLEVLVNKTWSRVKTAVISELSADLGGFPVEELMWPTGRDESYTPERNLTFKFTLLAVALSRPTAPEDVATFKTLAAARNKLAHGAAESIELLPSNETISLLRRYLSLVAKADVDGSL